MARGMVEEGTKVPPWAEGMVRLLDEAVRVPGTNFRIGLDGVLGLVLPQAGDALSALSSLSLFWLAYQRKLPRTLLLRMAVNVVVDTVVGAIPLLGDLFDFGFKANRKNLVLIERALAQGGQRPVKARVADRLFVAALVLGLLALMLVPLMLSIWLWRKLLGSGGS